VGLTKIINKNMVSKTYLTAGIIILSQLVRLLGIEIGQVELQTTIHTLVEISGAIFVLWNRFQKGDINAFGSLH